MASPRPRFRNAGKFVQTYMPSNYIKHKEYLRKQMTALGIEGPIKVSIEFYFPMLKSSGKNNQAANVLTYNVTKPDIDNILKTVMEAANTHIWKDDTQIVEVHSFKKYEETARVIMKITELEE